MAEFIYTPSPFMLPSSYYNKEKADHAVNFINQLCHTKSEWAGKPFSMMGWQEQMYKIIPITEYQRMIAESRLLNAQVRKAREYENLAALYRGTEYAKILDSYESEVLAGKPLIPLPELPERTYTATEIGKKLGISAKRVGMLTNEHDLKTKEYGMWFRDVALHRQDMEVPAFRYFENIIPVLKELL